MIGSVALAVVAAGCGMVRVSVSSTGEDANIPIERVTGVSDDGRYVLFVGGADNLVPNDTNQRDDVFRRDTKTNTTVRASVAANGDQLDWGGPDGTMSPDGRYVVFITRAQLDPADTNGLADVYLRDMTSNTVTWTSQPPTGGFPVAGGSIQYVASPPGSGLTVSADGRYVAFLYQPPPLSSASTLYRRDVQAGTTTPLATGLLGSVQGSTDGKHYLVPERCVTETCAANIHLIDLDGSAAAWPTLPFTSCGGATAVMSADGRRLAWRVWDAGVDPCLPAGVYVADRQTGTTWSIHDSPLEASRLVGLSRDGTSLTFLARGDLIAPLAPTVQSDLYAYDVLYGKTAKLNLATDGGAANGAAESTVISDLGHRIAFVSRASNLVADDGPTADVFARAVGVSAGQAP